MATTLFAQPQTTSRPAPLPFSARKCILLPIQTKNSIEQADQLYISIEKVLSDQQTCEQSQSKWLLDLLSRSRDNLDFYLSNPEIIIEVAKKYSAGLIFKTQILPIHNSSKDTYLLKFSAISIQGSQEKGNLKVLSIFEKSQVINFKSVNYISSILKPWLQELEKEIPYDSRIIEARHDRFLINSNYRFKKDSYYEVEIRRNRDAQSKESELIANAIINLDKNNEPVGTLSAYYNNSVFQAGDWIIIKNKLQESKRTNPPIVVKAFEQNQVSIGLLFGIGDTEVISETDSDETGGVLLGFHTSIQYWFFSNFALNFEYSKILDSFGSKNRSIRTEFYGEPSQSKFFATYLLPRLKMFPAWQAFLHVGIKETTFNHETIEGFPSHEVKGVMAGAKIKYKVKNMYALALDFTTLVVADYEEINILLGEASNVSNSSYKFSLIHNPYHRGRFGEFYLSIDTKNSEFPSGEILRSKETLFGYDFYFSF